MTGRRGRRRRHVEEGRGLSDRVGNFGYPRLRDTVTAILQKADERRSPTT